MVAAAIIGSAVIGGGASLVAGGAQADAATRSAELQAQATRESVAEQRRQFNLARLDLAPYRETGTNALALYAGLYGITRGEGEAGILSTEEMQGFRDRFTETPGYQFRFDEGIRALDRSASATGRLRGGGYTRELTRYGQGIAAGEFGTYADRLAGIAGMGQGATTTTGTLGVQTAGNISNALMAGAQGQGNALMAAGTARASGYAGAANAVSGGAQNWMLYNLLQRQGLQGNYDAGFT